MIRKVMTIQSTTDPSTMIIRLAALLDGRTLSHFERGFICSVNSWSRNGTDPHRLSCKQIARVEELYREKFGEAE